MKINFSKKLKTKKRVGRGISAGGGKTAGRGTKGQASRAGFKHKRGFEGGQNPITQRTPKLKGFKVRNKKDNIPVNLEILNKFKDGEVVNAKNLDEKGFIRNVGPIKILGRGELKKKLTVEAKAFSKTAKDAILKAGGEAKEVK